MFAFLFEERQTDERTGPIEDNHADDEWTWGPAIDNPQPPTPTGNTSRADDREYLAIVIDHEVLVEELVHSRWWLDKPLDLTEPLLRIRDPESSSSFVAESGYLEIDKHSWIQTSSYNEVASLQRLESHTDTSDSPLAQKNARAAEKPVITSKYFGSDGAEGHASLLLAPTIEDLEFQRDFQDKKADVDCLVTSMALSAFGVNYHANCSHGIIVKSPRNMNTLSEVERFDSAIRIYMYPTNIQVREYNLEHMERRGMPLIHD
ncbi:hypothetical protein M440DRAFT_1465529 [Trichoderma longibrachiatum ATCC 18648]|uniref:Helicase C-terminal domain-containing protein n=1 Tax=Trichoderma longibrachiatum ATCC 18648 TaxID=983965 RepID=A0A2T4BSV6_TRILO|nr:hypothetical protein M440DRAFT_1465529 [Trichoderma longibrachiatum ATCC 18648]